MAEAEEEEEGRELAKEPQLPDPLLLFPKTDLKGKRRENPPVRSPSNGEVTWCPGVSPRPGGQGQGNLGVVSTEADSRGGGAR